MSDMIAREIAFRAVIQAGSESFERGINCAADMVREAAKNQAFLCALRRNPAAALGQLADAIQAATGQEVQGG